MLRESFPEDLKSIGSYPYLIFSQFWARAPYKLKFFLTQWKQIEMCLVTFIVDSSQTRALEDISFIRAATSKKVYLVLDVFPYAKIHSNLRNRSQTFL